eukprot:scaffold13233_cov21-Tisochrysis_lutea.AAC.5
MAWHSLQLMIEQQPQGNALASLIREVLGGMKAIRPELANEGVEDVALPVSFMPEVVQLMLAYIQ